MFYKIVRNVAYLLVKILFFTRFGNMEVIPETGGVIVCANHRSMWDAVLIAAAVKRPMSFIAKEELFKFKPLGFILKHLNCYAVKRDGGDIAVVKAALRLLRDGQVLMVFPEGQRIRKGKKPNPKQGALRLGIMTGTPIVPVGIKGDFKLFHKMELTAGAVMDTSSKKGIKYTEEEYMEMNWKMMDEIYALAGTEYLHD